MFSGEVTSTRGAQLADLIRVRQVEQHMIYLGIPTNVGWSQSAIFRTLVAELRKN